MIAKASSVFHAAGRLVALSMMDSANNLPILRARRSFFRLNRRFRPLRLVLIELRFATRALQPKGRRTMAATDVGMIGLGIMGSAMSANLMQAGFKVLGYDVAPRRRAEHRKAGGDAARDCREV